ncbi:E3 ubiquitin-protein ligase ORTHRUS 1 [Linum perenne]
MPSASHGFKVCWYLFVRCDNEPAPWTSDEHGDMPRPLPNIHLIKQPLGMEERPTSEQYENGYCRSVVVH